MEFLHYDKIEPSEGLSRKFSPQGRIVVIAILSITIIFLPAGNWLQLCLFILPAIVLAILFKTSAVFIFKRSLIFVPIVVVIGLSSLFLSKGTPKESATLWGTALLKSYLVALVAMVFLSTLRFPDLLSGLIKLKTPSLLIILFALMHRYLFLLTEEALRMDRARRARTISQNSLNKFRTFSKLTAMLLLRVYERSERVGFAMLSRGFEGRCRLLSRQSQEETKDALFLSLVSLFSIANFFWAVLK